MCNYIARNEARLEAHKDIKHIQGRDICNYVSTYYLDENISNYKDSVHKNGDIAFTDGDLKVWRKNNISDQEWP